MWGCVHYAKQYLTNKVYNCKCVLRVSLCKHICGKCMQMCTEEVHMNDFMLFCVQYKWAWVHVFTTVIVKYTWGHCKYNMCVCLWYSIMCVHVWYPSPPTVLCLESWPCGCGSPCYVSPLTCPGLGSINTFTVPGCGWAFINSLEIFLAHKMPRFLSFSSASFVIQNLFLCLTDTLENWYYWPLLFIGI